MGMATKGRIMITEKNELEKPRGVMQQRSGRQLKG
jgi:hypothetical protein